MNRNSDLYRKTYGCLIAGVVGDAMGAPAEDMTYSEVKEKFGWITDFEGVGTDDSAIKLILCEAILDNAGHVTADEFARAFLNNKDKYYDLFYIPVRNMFHKIESQLSLPVYAGMGNMHSSSSAMAIAPMGIINACNPRQAAIETYDVAGLIHAGDTTFCRDGACVIAAAVAEAMTPDATVESVVDAASRYLHRDSSVVMRTRIRETLSMVEETGSYEAFRARYYETSLGDIVSDSRETVPCVLALVVLAQGDPVTAIEYGANFGRDADTIATMAGAICGALNGIDSLKPEWVERIAKSLPDQDVLAEQLAQTALDKAQEQQTCRSRLSRAAGETEE